jgi:hypothetical protein
MQDDPTPTMPRWLPGSPVGSFLRMRLEPAKWTHNWLSIDLKDPSTLQFKGDCFVSNDGGVSWIADEGGHFAVVPASRYPAFQVTRPDTDPYSCVGFYQNRMDPSWFSEEDADLFAGVYPEQWRDSKYQVVALLELARPKSEIESLWSHFRSCSTLDIEVVVGHGSPNSRPPSGFIHGGRIFAFRLIGLPPWDTWVA